MPMYNIVTSTNVVDLFFNFLLIKFMAIFLIITHKWAEFALFLHEQKSLVHTFVIDLHYKRYILIYDVHALK